MHDIGHVNYNTITDYNKKKIFVSMVHYIWYRTSKILYSNRMPSENKDTSNTSNSTDIIVSLHTLHHSTPQITNSIVLEKCSGIIDLSPAAHAGVFPKDVVLIAAKEI
jgi:hypothetical protein